MSTNISFTSSLLKKSLAYAALVLLTTPSAFAVDFLLTVGREVQVTVNTSDRFLIDLGAARSYSCEAVPTASTTLFDWSATVVGTGTSAEMITADLKGSVVPQIGGESGGNADNRITFTPTTSDRFALTVGTALGIGESVLVRCVATTLFGNYNTNVNDFNFLELVNIGNQTITGSYTALQFDGTVVISPTVFTVTAQRRVDIDIHTAAGQDKFGIIRVTHDAPLGTLQANLSQYSGTVSNFSLQATTPLVPFDQK